MTIPTDGRPVVLDLASLIQDPANPRLHSEANRSAIESSLADFGAGRSVLVDKNGQIIAGNATVEAALAAGFQEVLIVPTTGKTMVAVARMDLDANSPQAHGLAVADNRTAELGSWDHDRLAAVAAEGLTLTDYGWDQSALSALLTQADDLNPAKTHPGDKTPEPPEIPWVEPGDLLELGPHRLLCGDAEDDRAYQKVLGAIEPGIAKADMVFADPPYGVGYQSKMRPAGQPKRFQKLANDDVILTRWIDLLPLFLVENSAVYCCTRWDVYPQWKPLFQNEFLRVKNCIVWYKGGGGLGDLEGDYWPDHEFIIYAVNGKHILRGGRQGNVWEIPKVSVNDYKHPTQKPVDLAVNAILKSSDIGDIVLDPFCGSGTSIVAAHGLKRVVAALELDPKWCQVSAERFQADTGIEPIILREGRRWSPRQLKEMKEVAK